MISSSSGQKSQDGSPYTSIKEERFPSSSCSTVGSPADVSEKYYTKTDLPESPLSSASSLKSPDSTTNFVSLTSPKVDSNSSSSSKIDCGESNSSNLLCSSNDSTGNLKTCSVCGDKDAVEAFGATSCDSCRGFFKRAIKNSRSYTCIGTGSCSLNKKNRNHCKECRLKKCYKVGMNSDAAKEYVEREKLEKLDKKRQSKTLTDNSSTEVSSSLTESTSSLCIEINEINEAELFVDPKINNFANISVDPIRQLCLAADKQLASLAEWAKRLPYFTTLNIADQVKLLQWNWAELLIGGFCYRSSAVSDGILLATGLHLSRENLQKAGVGTIVNKLFGEVINKMQKLQITVSEWGCLRAIMLFAPDTKELTEVDKVESIRERYVATLCKYTKTNSSNDPNRLGNLLLRLPPLKAIALQVLEHLFFFKLIGDVPIDTFLLEMLDDDSH